MTVIIEEYSEKAVDNQIIVYIKNKEKVLILNRTASVIFSMFREQKYEDIGSCMEDLSKKVSKEFNIPIDVATRDVDDLINNLLNHSLISDVDGSKERKD